MTEFMNGHHCIPAQRHERKGKQQLIESFHSVYSGAIDSLRVGRRSQRGKEVDRPVILPSRESQDLPKRK